MKRSKVDLPGGREAVSSEQIAVFYGPGQQLSIWLRRRKNPNDCRHYVSGLQTLREGVHRKSLVGRLC